MSGIGLFWLFSHLLTKYNVKWIQFPESFEATDVLYGSIEDFETATKLKFVPEDMGGIYKDKDEIVIGSIKGERRCHIKDLSYELINHSTLIAIIPLLRMSYGFSPNINFIKITIDDEVIAFFPTWTGPELECTSSIDKAQLGYECLQQLTTEIPPTPKIT